MRLEGGDGYYCFAEAEKAGELVQIGEATLSSLDATTQYMAGLYEETGDVYYPLNSGRVTVIGDYTAETFESVVTVVDGENAVLGGLTSISTSTMARRTALNGCWWATTPPTPAAASPSNCATGRRRPASWPMAWNLISSMSTTTPGSSTPHWPSTAEAFDATNRGKGSARPLPLCAAAPLYLWVMTRRRFRGICFHANA